jgi:hypothetical protein
MASVAKGNPYEDCVFAAVKNDLDGVRLGLSPKLAGPYKEKGYQSRDRDDQSLLMPLSICGSAKRVLIPLNYTRVAGFVPLNQP